MQSSLLVRLLVVFVLVSMAGCASMNDVVKAKAEGKGIAKEYPLTYDQAWELCKATFRREGSDSIEEHKDENYMLTSTGAGIYCSTNSGLRPRCPKAPAMAGRIQVTEGHAWPDAENCASWIRTQARNGEAVFKRYIDFVTKCHAAPGCVAANTLCDFKANPKSQEVSWRIEPRCETIDPDSLDMATVADIVH